MERKPPADIIEIKRLLDKGLSKTAIAKKLGVTKGRISQLTRGMRAAAAKTVMEKKVPAIVRRELNAADQLQNINVKANKLLDELMCEEESLNKIVKLIEAKLVAQNAWSEVEERKALARVRALTQDIVHDKALAIKAMAEIRGQLKLQLEIYQALYDLQAVADFQAEIVDLLGEVDPSVKREFVKRLKERRALQSAIGNPRRDE